jgi:hypothetical protein
VEHISNIKTVVKVLADDYRIVKEQLHKYATVKSSVILCSENHIGMLKTMTLSKLVILVKPMAVSGKNEN